MLIIIELLLFCFHFFFIITASSWPTIESKNHYAIVVDAGSSGSRAYLYHWPEENTSDLLKITPLTDVKNEPLVKSVSPGKNFTNVLSISFGDLPIHMLKF